MSEVLDIKLDERLSIVDYFTLIANDLISTAYVSDQELDLFNLKFNLDVKSKFLYDNFNIYIFNRDDANNIKSNKLFKLEYEFLNDTEMYIGSFNHVSTKFFKSGGLNV